MRKNVLITINVIRRFLYLFFIRNPSKKTTDALASWYFTLAFPIKTPILCFLDKEFKKVINFVVIFKNKFLHMFSFLFCLNCNNNLCNINNRWEQLHPYSTSGFDTVLASSSTHFLSAFFGEQFWFKGGLPTADVWINQFFHSWPATSWTPNSHFLDYGFAFFALCVHHLLQIFLITEYAIIPKEIK